MAAKKATGKKVMAGALALALALPAALPAAAGGMPGPRVRRVLRAYQKPVFEDKQTKLALIEFGRQMGKTETGANWCVDRCLQKMMENRADGSARWPMWTVLILSNSKANGAEFARRAAEICRDVLAASGEVEAEFSGPDVELEEMKHEVRIRVGDRVGRLLVQAASPRTARGVPADVWVDEFAFQEDAHGIFWAAWPTVTGTQTNPDTGEPEPAPFVMRISSTHNGVSSYFNQLIKSGKYKVYSVSRTAAWETGELILQSAYRTDANGKPLVITAAEAREEAEDKAEYDQNFENIPGDSTQPLISGELLTRSLHTERFVGCEQTWSVEAEEWLRELGTHDAWSGWMFTLGQDVARITDLSVVTVLGTAPNGERRVVAMLEMKNVPFFENGGQLKRVVDAAEWLGTRFGGIAVDYTGMGGPFAEALVEAGLSVVSVNFSRTVPLDEALRTSGRQGETMLITERMAMDVVGAMQDGRFRLPPVTKLLDDMRKPGKVVSADGRRVSIAAARTKEGHADRFWSVALALHQALHGSGGGVWTVADLGGVDVGRTQLVRAGRNSAGEAAALAMLN